jgi:hypothetical protein
MLKIERITKNDRQLKALTGLSIGEFELLLKSFEPLLYQQFASKERQRKVGGGRKGALIDARSKLFYILFYLKVYPTYDLAGFVFGVDRSRCCNWFKGMSDIVQKALGRNIVLPKRQVRSMEELLAICPEVKDLFIDATERKTQRPKKLKLRSKRYSGKKKMPSRKNTIISDEKRRIVFVSPTREGKLHDLKQLKKTGILQHIPKDITLWVDKGYQGIERILQDDNNVMIPHRKPRGRELSDEQKQENRLISGIRIVVEHAINGIKRFSAMSSIYRNRKGQDDSMIYLCASLWNFHLQYKDC